MSKKETDTEFIDSIINEEDYQCSGMQVILKMVKNGFYRLGEIHKLNYYTEPNRVSFKNYSPEQLTDKVCNFLLSYGKCHFEDVPEKARTRDFYINAFTDRGVYEYIENHVCDFDKEFFRDLIATNRYALIFKNNAFEIMPLEYITTEMVDIAFIINTNWSGSDWFQSVVRRKPEAISYQAWLCAARYYTSVYNVLNVVPERYKTKIFYLELMSCSFNVGMSLEQDKQKVIGQLGDDVMTPEFLRDVICLDISNVGRIPERYLETELDFGEHKMEVWKACMLAEPNTITRIQPSIERIQFFKDTYGDNSFNYRLYCEDIEKEFGK